MKRLASVIFTCAVGLVVSACAVGSDPDRPLSSIDPAAAIAQAKMSVKKTDAVGFLWRDTAKLISDAEAAAAKGDGATAVSLAEQAKSQAENGYRQYERSRQGQ